MLALVAVSMETQVRELTKSIHVAFTACLLPVLIQYVMCAPPPQATGPVLPNSAATLPAAVPPSVPKVCVCVCRLLHMHA